jgi:hypothetical protein
MAEPAPVSFHLDLYRYWLSKRGGRTMPARGDIDPADIPALLPYLGIVDKIDGQLRYRLVGTDIVRQYGRELTGSFVGSHLSNAPESVAALRTLGERVFTSACPIFMTGQYKTKSGDIQNSSALILPLSDDGKTVNKQIFSRIARFSLDVTASHDWLERAPLRLGEVAEVHGIPNLEKLCLDWERHCVSGATAGRALQSVPDP